MNSKIIQAGEPETTGRYIVTFREGGHADGLAALKKGAGLTKAKMMSSADFGATGMDMSQLPSDGGAMFEHLGIALVNIDSNAAGAMALEAGEDSSILAIEPEGVMYALSELLGLSRTTCVAFATQHRACMPPPDKAKSTNSGRILSPFSPIRRLTWGLQATKAGVSNSLAKASASPSWTLACSSLIPTSPVARLFRSLSSPEWRQLTTVTATARTAQELLAAPSSRTWVRAMA
jgi:hypothetical protein